MYEELISYFSIQGFLNFIGGLKFSDLPFNILIRILKLTDLLLFVSRAIKLAEFIYIFFFYSARGDKYLFIYFLVYANQVNSSKYVMVKG